ncbi:OmpA family protein [Oceanivirga salmonicida]|uniref:OmpA family protein n=1 Tax=Oceanivirga salmonicida TaxID=1769291 RepID=UPI0012E28840|nr:OmpA family protein [Oceanivirga salmonicida]
MGINEKMRWVKKSLKNKRSITIGLMISFLISGHLGFGREKEFKTPGAKANGKATVAIGKRANASFEKAHAFGTDAKASGEKSYAIGVESEATELGSHTFGFKTVSNGHSAFAIGNHAKAYKFRSFAIGGAAISKGEKSFALGSDAVSNGTASYAIGRNATSNDTDSFSIGTESNAKKQQSFALGYKAKTDGESAYAIGSESNATAQNAFAIGHNSNAKADSSYAIGNASTASKRYAYAIGIGANAQEEDSYAIGHSAVASKQKALAIGNEAHAKGKNAVALGTSATTALDNAVALGSGAVATVNKGEIGYDFLKEGVSSKANGAWKSTHAAVSIGKADGSVTRQINGLAAGTNDTDAVNVAQIKALEIGKGKVKSNDKKTVTGATVHEYVKDNVKKLIDVKSSDASVTVNKNTDGNGKKTFDLIVDKNKLADTFAKKDGSNITGNNVTKWKEKLGIGDGDISNAGPKADNTVTGKTVHNYVTKEIATLTNNGLKFAGNIGKATIKLGEELAIKGDLAVGEASSSKNVTTEIVNKKLEIKIAEKPKFNEVEAGTGTDKVVIGENNISLGGEKFISNKGLNANNKTIANVAKPTQNTDAANKKYVDDKVTGLTGGLVSNLKYTGDDGAEKTLNIKNESLKIKGDAKNIETISTANGNISIKLKDEIEVGTTSKVKVSGTDGTVTGLTNKGWDPSNIKAGRAATEDQLKKVDDKIETSKKAAIEGVEVEGTTGEITVTKDTNTPGKIKHTLKLDTELKKKIDNIGKGKISDTDADKVKTVTGEAVHKYVKDNVQKLIDVKSSDASVTVTEKKDGTGKKTFDLVVDKNKLADTFTKKDASNLDPTNVSDWKKKLEIGDGVISDTDAKNTHTVTGKTVFEYVKDKGLNFEGNTGLAELKLDEKLEIKGALTGAGSSDNVKTVITGKKLEIQIAKKPKFEEIEAGTGTDKVIIGENKILLGGKTFITKTGLDANNLKITNVETPTTDKDAANKKYVDDKVTGLSGGLVSNLKYAGDDGVAQTLDIKNGTLSIKGDTKNVETVSDANGNISIKLKDEIEVGTAKKVKISGTDGTVTGLTNKDWNPATIESGRAATEDQLKIVDGKIETSKKEAIEGVEVEGTAGEITITKDTSTPGKIKHKVGLAPETKDIIDNIGKGKISDTDADKGKTVTGEAVHKHVKDTVHTLVDASSSDNTVLVDSKVDNNTGKKTFDLKVNETELAKKFANKDASNIDAAAKDKWKEKLEIGDGVISDTDAKNTHTITGKTVFDYMKNKGLSFAGNKGLIALKLDETLDIKGTLASTETSSSKNVTTEIVDKKLEIKIAEKPKFNEVEAGTGADKVIIGENKIELGGKTYITKNGLDANNNKIVNVADPTNDKDAVNKKFLETELAKISAGVASTLNYEGNTGGKQALDLKTGTFKVKGDDKNVTTESKSDGSIEIKLKDKIAIDKITVDGEKGNITGLENKTWDSNNIISGRAATEDQLKKVDDKTVENKKDITKINDKLKNAVEYDGPNKDKVTLGGKNGGTIIGNVKDGVDDKDAVNKGQLDKVKADLEKSAKDSVIVEGKQDEIVVTNKTDGNVKTSTIELAQPIKDKIAKIGAGKIVEGDQSTVTGDAVHKYVKDNVEKLVNVDSKDKSIKVLATTDNNGKKTFDLAIDKVELAKDFAKKDASNLDDDAKKAWSEKLSDGANIETPDIANSRLVTDKQVHDYVKNNVGNLVDVVQKQDGGIEVIGKTDPATNKKTFTVGLDAPTKEKIDEIGTGKITETDEKTVSGKTVHKYIKDNTIDKDGNNLTVDQITKLSKKLVGVTSDDKTVKVKTKTDATGKVIYDLGVDKVKLAEDFAKKDASNIDAAAKDKWKEKLEIGDGVISDSDAKKGHTVTGETVHKYVKDTVNTLVDANSSNNTVLIESKVDNNTGKKTFDLKVNEAKLEEKFANKDASNIDAAAKDKWKEKLGIGDGEISDSGPKVNNTVTGKKVHDYVENRVNGIQNNVSKLSGGIATSMAMANIPQVSDRHLVSIGAGGAYYDKAGGFALGISGTIPSRTLIYKVSAGIDTKKKFGVGLGLNVNLVKEKSRALANDEKQMKMFDRELANLKQGLTNTNQELEKLKTKLESEPRVIKEVVRVETPKDDINNLKKELENLKIKVDEKGEIQTKGKIPISCGTTTKMCTIRGFEVDGREPSEEEKTSLKQIVAILNTYYKDKLIDVIGYTDNVGNADYNYELGLERAENITKYLKELGLDESIVIRNVSSFGESRIVKSNKTAQGRYMNRRVELLFTDK